MICVFFFFCCNSRTFIPLVIVELARLVKIDFTQNVVSSNLKQNTLVGQCSDLSLLSDTWPDYLQNSTCPLALLRDTNKANAAK